jgi:excisionase family DNA binding protein
MKRLLTLKEFAEELSISEALARKWQRLGAVRITKLGRCVRVPSEEVDRLIAIGIENRNPARLNRSA